MLSVGLRPGKGRGSWRYFRDVSSRKLKFSTGRAKGMSSGFPCTDLNRGGWDEVNIPVDPESNLGV